ncbi:hypothetical protein K438DRAFT_1987854 [Mycena galopus ATCC 62051]|nr:hypothetical protein K438DRAFT_1987854 [Mycena galopus ATCC 62051]
MQGTMWSGTSDVPLACYHSAAWHDPKNNDLSSSRFLQFLKYVDRYWSELEHLVIDARLYHFKLAAPRGRERAQAGGGSAPGEHIRFTFRVCAASSNLELSARTYVAPSGCFGESDVFALPRAHDYPCRRKPLDSEASSDSPATHSISTPKGLGHTLTILPPPPPAISGFSRHFLGATSIHTPNPVLRSLGRRAVCGNNSNYDPPEWRSTPSSRHIPSAEARQEYLSPAALLLASASSTARFVNGLHCSLHCTGHAPPALTLTSRRRASSPGRGAAPSDVLEPVEHSMVEVRGAAIEDGSRAPAPTPAPSLDGAAPPRGIVPTLAPDRTTPPAPASTLATSESHAPHAYTPRPHPRHTRFPTRCCPIPRPLRVRTHRTPA